MQAQVSENQVVCFINYKASESLWLLEHTIAIATSTKVRTSLVVLSHKTPVNTRVIVKLNV